MRKMKRNIIISIVCLMILSTVFITAAHSSEFYYEDEDITITFESDTDLSYEQKQAIADKIVYGSYNDDQISTYSWCWLVGHDTVLNAVAAIQHKVEETTPRCIKRVYEVESCTACDYIKEDLISTTYIDCCPED